MPVRGQKKNQTNHGARKISMFPLGVRVLCHFHWWLVLPCVAAHSLIGFFYGDFYELSLLESHRGVEVGGDVEGGGGC